ncbi:hypothetical protein EVC24_041 [Rhizobium phage RHph_I4]|nr:hypothetical protein EVC24_041 [Rhizobium phage RHph_I4]
MCGLCSCNRLQHIQRMTGARMSTRDEDSEDGLLPSNGTGYRFPIRDRRFENRIVEAEENEDDVDDDEGLDLVPDDVADDGDLDTPLDLSSVRSRVRGPLAPSTPSPVSAAPQPSETPTLPSDAPVDDDTPPEEPGVQVIDTPRSSRVRNAASRARNVQLSDRASRLIDNPGYAPGTTDPLIGMVATAPRRGQTDNRSIEEFDEQFIADARAAFGEGFIPANQLPGDVGDRIRHIVTVANIYASEFILDQLERMILSKVPVDTIAARFRVNTRTIWVWRKKLKERWAQKVQELKSGDIASIIGEHMAKFEVRMAMGFALAQKPNATLQEVTRGLEIAERAQTNLIKYQDMLGLHKQLPLAISRDSANQEDQHVKNAKNVTNAIAELFGMASAFPVAGGDDDGDIEEDQYSQVAE